MKTAKAASLARTEWKVGTPRAQPTPGHES